MAELVLPRVQAMFLCDDVVDSDDEIGVFHLTGVRTTIEAASFPFLHSLFVFSQMSGHRGEVWLHGVIERSDTGEIIDNTESQRVTFERPTFVVPILFRFPNCVFPAPGVYYVQIYHERKLIGERHLTFWIEE